MRIAHLAFSFLPTIGGAEIVLHNLASAQAKAGHDVTIVAPWKYRARKDTGAPYRLLPLLPRSQRFSAACSVSRAKSFYIEAQLRRLHDRLNPDVWHAHSLYPAGCLVAQGLKKLDAPFIATSHGGDINRLENIGYGALPEIFDAPYVKESFRMFRNVTAVSSFMKDRYVEIGIPEKHITIVPNGIDCRRFRAVVPDRNKLLSALGIGDRKKIILTVARNHPVKGIDIMLETARHLAKIRDDFAWLWAGTDGHTAPVPHDLKQLLFPVPGEYAADKTCTQLPSDRVLDLYAAADVLVACSLMESFGCVILEAMGTGLPVAATDIPGYGDLVEHGRSGLCAPPDRPDTMAENINTILENTDIRAGLKAAGLEKAASHDWKYIEKSYRAEYQKAAGKQNERQ